MRKCDVLYMPYVRELTANELVNNYHEFGKHDQQWRLYTYICSF